MTLTIKNDKDHGCLSEQLENIRKFNNTFGEWFDTSKAQAALSAYEQSKIELSEDELVCLKWRAFGEAKRDELSNSIMRKYLVDAYNVVNKAGRAYLEAHKPRELKWEVHRIGVTNSFRLATNCKVRAVELMAYLEKVNDKRYELREVTCK